MSETVITEIRDLLRYRASGGNKGLLCRKFIPPIISMFPSFYLCQPDLILSLVFDSEELSTAKSKKVTPKSEKPA